MHFGEELRSARERRGITLDEVAERTRVSLRHLHALESDRFSDLPGGIFNRGIVRSYAQCCGLDADGTVRNFMAAVDASGLTLKQHDDDWVELAEAVHRNRQAELQPKTRMRWLGALCMVAAVCILAASVYAFLAHRGVIHGGLMQSLRHINELILSNIKKLRSKVT